MPDQEHEDELSPDPVPEYEPSVLWIREITTGKLIRQPKVEEVSR